MDLFPPLPQSLLNLDRLHLSEKEQLNVKGVMYIISSMFPQVENTSMLLALVAIFASAHMEPNDILGCMSSMIKAHSGAAQDRKEWAYFPLTRREALIFERVFKLIVKEHEPAVYAHIKRLVRLADGKDPRWNSLLDTMSIELLPKKVVKRVMDSYLIEGHKIIFRVALAHVHLRRSRILAATNIDEAVVAVFDPEHGHSRDLIDIIFGCAFQFSLSRRKIEYYRSKAKRSAFEDVEEGEAKRQLVLQRPLPRLTLQSEFVNEANWIALWSWIPSRLRMLDLDQIYSSDKHGYSLQTLYSKCETFDYLLILLETTDGAVLGVFTTKSLDHRHSMFFGTGETFLFTLNPLPKRYPWKAESASASFIFASHEYMAFGAGSAGFGIRIDAGLEIVESNPTPTFDNPRLLDEPSAKIASIEVYTFV